MTHPHTLAGTEIRSGHTSPRIGGRIAMAWRAYWQRRARLATVHLLHSLDDRTLHDIGVGRSEISSIVYGRRGERMRCYHESWRSWHAGT